MSDVATPGARHALYSVLEEVLGHEHADTLMTYLPAHRSEEVATKGDIARLEAASRADIARLEAATQADIARLEERFDRMEAQLDVIRRDFRSWQRTTLLAQAGMLTAVTAVFAVFT